MSEKTLKVRGKVLNKLTKLKENLTLLTIVVKDGEYKKEKVKDQYNVCCMELTEIKHHLRKIYGE